MEIHLGWIKMELPAKQWLRENAGAQAVPDHVAVAVAADGGALSKGTLTQREWDFIVTESEFVD